ncbi:uncharacterized protein MELLADRAFT_69602 [Melampsora larici-populina 98AG31]|uniref:Uncharacterized protein n=1 Tax=Melampsora larici-populina (strain 98AG31 / pathotype 3-4-7) TaxID=747676 RepID=F4SBB9_MELLP|nr:uncharacterized protein MELLADRAFT_69602 [Melampsora larici-populina 98AG31]EGF98068.1 hypothetical protein MELLADRAFT_69602 [Melampsora larici-populina 98AG31]
MPDINSTWTDENPDNHLTSIPTSTSSLDLKVNNTTLTIIEPHLKPPISLSTTRKQCTPLNRALINQDLEVSEEEIIYLSRQLRHTNFMFSANSTSKHGGWNYLVTPVILDGDSYTFDPAGDYLMDKHLVTFELSPFKPLDFTRDSPDWIQHNMTIDTKILPHIKICKQHKDWASKPNLGQFQALERVKSNIYVARTLKDFQEALERVASMSSRLQALHVAADEMHTQSSGLKPSENLWKTQQGQVRMAFV